MILGDLRFSTHNIWGKKKLIGKDAESTYWTEKLTKYGMKKSSFPAINDITGNFKKQFL